MDAHALALLQDRLGYRFTDLGLLREAMTHPSVVVRGGSRASSAVSNQRLEFLGDRVVGLVAAKLLLARFPGEEEGSIARRHTAIVNGEALAEMAESLDLGSCLALSQGEEETGGRTNRSTLADALEAVVAALFLDGGLAVASAFLEPRLQDLIDLDKQPPIDPKTALQEYVQARGEPLPAYEVVAQTGPAHQPAFEVQVRIAGHPPASATAGSKRAAEKAAATAMLKLAGVLKDD